MIALCYSPGSFSFYGAAVLQKGGDDKVKNAAFEEKHVVLRLGYFFLCVGEGREAAKITSSITGRNQGLSGHLTNPSVSLLSLSNPQLSLFPL